MEGELVMRARNWWSSSLFLIKWENYRLEYSLQEADHMANVLICFVHIHACWIESYLEFQCWPFHEQQIDNWWICLNNLLGSFGLWPSWKSSKFSFQLLGNYSTSPLGEQHVWPHHQGSRMSVFMEIKPDRSFGIGGVNKYWCTYISALVDMRYNQIVRSAS